MQLKKLIGTKDFYRVLLAVAVPIMIQNGISNFISLLDNVMVGQLGTEQMSGVSIVNQLFLVFNLCIFGAVSGAGLFGAQFFGKGDLEGLRHSFRFKWCMTLTLFALAMALFLLAGDPLIRLYLHSGSETGDLVLTLHYAKQYMAIMLVGLLPSTVTQIYASSLRETSRSVPPMLAGVAGVLVNLSLNYVLIFGKLGLPALGVRGAAIATVVSRFVECGSLILWTHLHTEDCPFIKGAYRSLYVPRPLVRSILRMGAPLMLNEGLWAAGTAALLQCYSERGLAVVSAMNITNTVFNTCSVAFIAIGSAISILIGQRLGAGEREEALDAAGKMIFFSLLTGIASGILVGCLAPYFPYLYKTTDEVRGLATKLTLVIALAAPIHAFLNASYFTLRSGGKTLLTFLFDSGYVWCVNLLLALVLIHLTSLPILPIYAICQFVDVVKCVIGGVLVKKGIWIRDITGKTPSAPAEKGDMA